MHPTLSWGHALLAQSPIWLTFAIIYFLTIGILPIGRAYFEKLPYNNAFSSEYGDIALVLIICIGATIIQRKDFVPMVRMESGLFNAIFAGIGILTGVIWQGVVSVTNAENRKTTEMDFYHNTFVAALLVYLLGMTLPVIICYGTFMELITAAGLSAIWVLLVIYDHETGRADQSRWLEKHYRS